MTEATQPVPQRSDPPKTVVLEGLHKSFGEQHVLRGIDLSIAQGELVAIVGNSGSGKTVLLHCIIAHIKPESGRALVADVTQPGLPLYDVAALDDDALDRLRLHWAIVFQRNALFTGTVYDNIALGPHELRGDTREDILPRAREALKAVGLDPDQVLDRARDDRSGGMAKRVAIARALVLDPAMIFYDEPTAGLDPEHSALVHDLIRSTHERPTSERITRTSVVVTHDTGLLARLQPRVVMIHEGRVFFDGAFEEFARSDSAPIRPYFEAMAAVHACVRESRVPVRAGRRR
ncbi:MAG: ATP-binding cassette domain-containing protein [Phycisphaerales bacterium]|nr:ATP-binding cassette domain-containing protein [Phycisphaerales bacterium]